MKKKFITGVIILMSIALLGIMVVQFFWIRNAIAVKEAQFDSSVNSALNDVVRQLDKRRNLLYITKNQIPIIPKIKPYFNMDSLKGKQEKQIIILRDSIHHFQKRLMQKHALEMSRMDSLLRIHAIHEKDRPAKGYKQLEHEIEMKEKILSSMMDSLSPLIQEQKRVYEARTQNIEKLVKDIVIEFRDDEDQLKKRLELSSIDTLIRSRLTDRGIDLDYLYAITNPETSQEIDVQSGGFQTENIDKSYRVSLFPENVFHRPENLLVYFPEKNKRIYRSLGWLMGGSVFFTLIIILAFIATIIIMLRQKKISDVKTDFINNMTHEFKTPIATIQLATDSIANEKIFSDREKVRYFLNIIRDENKRMNAQVENVLQMSLMDKRDFSMNFENVDAHELIERAIDKIRLHLNRKNGELIKNLSADNSCISTDPIHFTNVIYNLLDNAIKYSNALPQITVETRNEDDQVIISVEDQGIGMDADTQKQIFERFYRKSTGNVHNVKGFGLGLSYVRYIVDVNKGSIRVKSRKGEGSCFEIGIPLTHTPNL